MNEFEFLDFPRCVGTLDKLHWGLHFSWDECVLDKKFHMSPISSIEGNKYSTHLTEELQFNDSRELVWFADDTLLLEMSTEESQSQYVTLYHIRHTKTEFDDQYRPQFTGQLNKTSTPKNCFHL